MKPPVTRMRNMFLVVFPNIEFEHCLQTQGASKERSWLSKGKKKKKGEESMNQGYLAGKRGWEAEQ